MCAYASILCSDIPMIPFFGWKVQSMDRQSSFYSSKLNMTFQTGSQAQAHLCTIRISLISFVGTGSWLRRLIEPICNTSPGKGHEGR